VSATRLLLSSATGPTYRCVRSPAAASRSHPTLAGVPRAPTAAQLYHLQLGCLATSSLIHPSNRTGIILPTSGRNHGECRAPSIPFPKAPSAPVCARSAWPASPRPPSICNAPAEPGEPHRFAIPRASLRSVLTGMILNRCARAASAKAPQRASPAASRIRRQHSEGPPPPPSAYQRPSAAVAAPLRGPCAPIDRPASSKGIPCDVFGVTLWRAIDEQYGISKLRQSRSPPGRSADTRPTSISECALKPGARQCE
jgi:hypothetical protein